jgi:hypothetical protein
LAEDVGSAACHLGEACPLDPARGIDKARTGRTQEGFGILEQEIFVLGNKALEFVAFSRSQTPFVVLIEQPVQPCLAFDIESLQLDCYGGFSDSTGHSLIFSNTLPELYRGLGSLSNIASALSILKIRVPSIGPSSETG